MINPDNIVPIFIGVWVALGAVGLVLFFANKNAALKRKAWPPFVIGVGVLFAIFVYLMGFPNRVFIFLGPGIIFITILNLKAAKFCDKCGKTIMNQSLFDRVKYCTKCGARLST